MHQQTRMGKRAKGCSNCKGCQSSDCDKCIYCTDMIKFGGSGTWKQACGKRKCYNRTESCCRTKGFNSKMSGKLDTKTKKSSHVRKKLDKSLNVKFKCCPSALKNNMRRISNLTRHGLSAVDKIFSSRSCARQSENYGGNLMKTYSCKIRSPLLLKTSDKSTKSRKRFIMASASPNCSRVSYICPRTNPNDTGKAMPKQTCISPDRSQQDLHEASESPRCFLSSGTFRFCKTESHEPRKLNSLKSLRFDGCVTFSSENKVGALHSSSKASSLPKFLKSSQSHILQTKNSSKTPAVEKINDMVKLNVESCSPDFNVIERLNADTCTVDDRCDKLPKSKTFKNKMNSARYVQINLVPVENEIDFVGLEHVSARNVTDTDVKSRTSTATVIPTCFQKQYKSENRSSLYSEKAATVFRIKELQLPNVCLDTMTKKELKHFIPRLLQLITGKQEVFHSRRSAKPKWWPDDVAWVDNLADWFAARHLMGSLKSIVKSCYKYVGREDLIRGSVDHNHESYTSENVVHTSSSPYAPTNDLIPISAGICDCFFCEKEFCSKDRLCCHQKECMSRPAELQNVQTESYTLNKNIFRKTVKKSSSVINWPSLSLEKFSKYFDLVPTQAAAKLRERRPTLEIKCDLSENIEPVSPVTPLTPKTPRSLISQLISQLSRDESNHFARKRRLSYSNSVDKSTSLESDSESESETDKHTPGRELNFLNIPISSPLGQRIKKYVHVDSPMAVVMDMQSFCRTPVKNEFLDKLRKKPLSYPVLYRPRRIANLQRQNHVYKFSKQERKEFISRSETGLSLRSLEIYRTMKSLNIHVQRMCMKELLKWMPRYNLGRQLNGVFKHLRQGYCGSFDSNEKLFPLGPTLLAKNISKLLGFKKKSIQESEKSLWDLRQSPSLKTSVSEEMEAEVSKQKLTLYRCLLYEISVLKPVVVLEDIGKKMTKVLPKISVIGNLDLKDSDKMDSYKNSCFVVTKKDGAFNERCFCHLQCKDQEAEIEADQEKKTKCSTLKAILTSNNFLSPCAGACNESTHCSLSSAEVGRQKSSPRDDVISVMSMISDAESLHSNCCLGFTDKKHHSFAKMVLPAGNINPVQGKETLMEPLNVDVNATAVVCGIPSPISIAGEFPFPVTPDKSDFLSSPNTRLCSSCNTKVSNTSDLLDTACVCEFSYLPNNTSSSSQLLLPSLQNQNSPKMKHTEALKNKSEYKLSSFERSNIQSSHSETSAARSSLHTSSPVKRKLINTDKVLQNVPVKNASPKQLIEDITKSVPLPTKMNLRTVAERRPTFILQPSCIGEVNTFSQEVMNHKSGSLQKSFISSGVGQRNTSAFVTTKIFQVDHHSNESRMCRSKRKSSLSVEVVKRSKLRKVHPDIAVHSR